MISFKDFKLLLISIVLLNILTHTNAVGTNDYLGDDEEIDDISEEEMNLRIAELSLPPDYDDLVNPLSPIEYLTINTPITNFQSFINNWEIGGDASLMSGKYSNGDITTFVRTSSEKPGESGYIWSKKSLGASDWLVEIDYKLTNNHVTPAGNGMAIWFVRHGQHVLGNAFGSDARFNGLALVLDSQSDKEKGIFPAVQILKNQNEKYDFSTSGKNIELAKCIPKVYHSAEHYGTIRATYIRKSGLTIEVESKRTGEWQVCIEDLDISPMPNEISLGVSSANGNIKSNYDVFGVRSYSILDVGLVRNLTDARSEKELARAKEERNARRHAIKAAHKSYSTGLEMLKISLVLFTFGFMITLVGLYSYTTVKAKYNAKKYL